MATTISTGQQQRVISELIPEMVAQRATIEITFDGEFYEVSVRYLPGPESWRNREDLFVYRHRELWVALANCYGGGQPDERRPIRGD